MSSGFALRLLPAFAGALLVTLAVFLFMQSLISRGQDQPVPLAVYPEIEIVEPRPEEPAPPAPQDAPERVAEEPQLDRLQLAAPAPSPGPTLEMPALDLGLGEIEVEAVGDAFSAPLGAGPVNIPGGGQDASGFVEVVPFNTRRPNVPEAAWENRISGWVLVAFTVTPEGRTRDVRVLDARPRGVFEEKVIAAVEDWQYSLKFSGKQRANLVLTQKVEVRWQDYPDNLPNVD